MVQHEKITKVALLIVLLGGINYLFIGLFGVGFIGLIFGFIPLLERLIYILIGVAAGYLGYMGWKLKTLW